MKVHERIIRMHFLKDQNIRIDQTIDNLLVIEGLEPLDIVHQLMKKIDENTSEISGHILALTLQDSISKETQ